MEPLTASPPTLLSLLGTLLSDLSFANVNALLDLYQRVRKLWRRESDWYEILDYTATLELLDIKGENNIFRKHQKIRFLQNNIIAFEDYVWGDGNSMVDYRCTPGGGGGPIPRGRLVERAHLPPGDEEQGRHR